MSKRPYALPGLTQLASFEAAARHLSFKEAAFELNVTSSAISHQIRALEDDLSTTLFSRKNRKIALTEAGQKLFEQLKQSFQEIGETAEEIRALGAEKSVSIAATTAVSSLWLSPRVARFLKKFPDYRVNQTLSDDVNRSHEPANLRIIYGEKEIPKYKQVMLFRDELVPVASRSFASRYRSLTLPGLARLPLIQLQTEQSSWTSWEEWFQQMGYLGEINYSQRINNYLSALQAARDGAGVVLGWKHLVRPMIEREELVQLTEYSMPASEAFYLHRREANPVNPCTEEMFNWLMKSAQR